MEWNSDTQLPNLYRDDGSRKKGKRKKHFLCFTLTFILYCLKVKEKVKTFLMLYFNFYSLLFESKRKRERCFLCFTLTFILYC